MMKKILISIAFIISVLSVFAQKNKSEIIANKVKSVVVHEQKYEKSKKDDTKEPQALIDSETQYDTNGNIISEKEYKNGIIDKQMTYQYDSNNNLIKETEINSAGKKVKIIDYKYNGNLKIEETETNSAGKKVRITQYKYNGNLKTEKAVYDGNNKLKSKKTYQYQKY